MVAGWLWIDSEKSFALAWRGERIVDDLNFLQDSYCKPDLDIDLRSVVIVEQDREHRVAMGRYLERVMGVRIVYYSYPEQDLAGIVKALVGQTFCLVMGVDGDQGAVCWDLLSRELVDQGLSFFAIAITQSKATEFSLADSSVCCLPRPLAMADLAQAVRRGFEQMVPSEPATRSMDAHRAQTETCGPCFKLRPVGEEELVQGMVGRSAQMKRVFDLVGEVAGMDSSVLITGPSGTGKKLAARAIHYLSRRFRERKVDINCAAMPPELLESELFGPAEETLAGANVGHQGRFGQARGGTLLLSEIAALPLNLQDKLLRALGGQDARSVVADVRVVATAHSDLEDLVGRGKFRRELYGLLNASRIKMPALSQRGEDILALIAYFLSRYSDGLGRRGPDFDDQALELLLGYDWPGNVRELENVIERLVTLGKRGVVAVADLPAKISRHHLLSKVFGQNGLNLPQEGLDVKRVLSQIEDSLIVQALTRTKGNKNQASKLLQLNRTTLLEKMKKKNISLG